MQLFKYILIDSIGKTRIGYIEGEHEQQIAEKFKATRVKTIISIHTFTLVNVNLLDRRKIFSFLGTNPKGTIIEGTIEHISDLDAYKELVEEYGLEIEILVEGNRPVSNAKSQFLPITEQIKSKYQTLKQSQALKGKTEAFFKTPSITPDETSQITSILDKDFKDLLLSIKKITDPLLLDKDFQEDIESIHTTISVLLGRASTTQDQKYDFLSYLLRELSFIEDTIDQAFIRESIRKVLTKTVQLLQKLEKIKARQAPTPKTTPPAPKEQKPIFGNYIQGSKELEEKKREVEVQAKKLVTTPNKEQAEELKNSFVSYQKKKEQVKALEVSIEKLKQEENREKDHYTPLHVSSQYALFKEVPGMTEWLCMFYIFIILLGESLYLSETALKIGNIDFTNLLAAIAIQNFNLKIIFSFLLLHVFFLMAKKQSTPHKSTYLFAFLILLGIGGIFYLL